MRAKGQRLNENVSLFFRKGTAAYDVRVIRPVFTPVRRETLQSMGFPSRLLNTTLLAGPRSVRVGPRELLSAYGSSGNKRFAAPERATCCLLQPPLLLNLAVLLVSPWFWVQLR